MIQDLALNNMIWHELFPFLLDNFFRIIYINKSDLLVSFIGLVGRVFAKWSARPVFNPWSRHTKDF